MELIHPLLEYGSWSYDNAWLVKLLAIMKSCNEGDDLYPSDH
jgi:hypothetical protein